MNGKLTQDSAHRVNVEYIWQGAAPRQRRQLLGPRDRQEAAGDQKRQ